MLLNGDGDFGIFFRIPKNPHVSSPRLESVYVTVQGPRCVQNHQKTAVSNLQSLYVNYFRYDHPFGMPVGGNYDHGLDYTCVSKGIAIS